MPRSMARWRARASARRAGGAAPTFQISDANPTAWFRPSTYTVGNWPDSSVNGYHATQATGSLQPAVAVGGGASFDGGDRLASNLPADNEDEAAWVVHTPTDLNNRTLLGSSINGGRQGRRNSDTYLAVNRQGVAVRGSSGPLVGRAAGVKTMSYWSLLAAPTVGDQHHAGFDGVVQLTSGYTDTAAFTGSTTAIGSQGGGAFDAYVGTIHEIVVLSARPTLDIRQKIEGRLAWDHGLTLPIDHPYFGIEPPV